MPFSSLSGAQQILVKLYMQGGPQYRAEMEKAGLATKTLSAETLALAAAQEKATKRTFLYNQTLFMARRFLFYTTLGTIGLAAAVFRLGMNYYNTSQQAEVAFRGFIKGTANVKREMKDLFVLAAETPFEFPDIVLATRRLLPFTSGVKETNQVVSNLVDSLSAAGILTGAALQKATLAMSHMYSMGRLTGQILSQLARDNVPMLLALQHYFHATGEEIRTAVAGGLIDAHTAAVALNKYMQTPGFKGAGLRQANETLLGAWTTFKDILSIAVGTSQAGMFEGIRKSLAGINQALLPMIQGKKPVTIENLVKAIDSKLSPTSHIIINLFEFMDGALKGLIGTLYFFYKALTIILWPLNKIGNLFGTARLGAKLLGIAVGILTGLILIQKGVLGAFAIATEIAAAKQILLGDAIALTTAKTKEQLALEAAAGSRGLIKRLLFGRPGGVVSTVPVGQLSKSPTLDAALKRRAAIGSAEEVGATGGLVGMLGRGIGKLFDTRMLKQFKTELKYVFYMFKEGGWRAGFRALLVGLRLLPGAFLAAAAGVWELTVALLALPVTWIVLGVIALIGVLVLLYRKWDWFHYLVNDSAGVIRKYWQVFVLAIPVFGWVIFILVQLYKHFDAIKRIIMAVIDAIKMLIGWWKMIPGVGLIGRGIKGTFHAIGGAAHWLTTEDVKQRAGGGSIWSTSPVIVGEHGPELVTLPGGSYVMPAQSSRQVEGLGSKVSHLWNGREGNDRPILVQVMLDRKVLAEGVARANQDYASRR